MVKLLKEKKKKPQTCFRLFYSTCVVFMIDHSKEIKRYPHNQVEELFAAIHFVARIIDLERDSSAFHNTFGH